MAASPTPTDLARKRPHRRERPRGAQLQRLALPLLAVGAVVAATWSEPLRPLPAAGPAVLAAVIAAHLYVRRPRTAARRLRIACTDLRADLPTVDRDPDGLPVPGGHDAALHLERIIERPRNVRLAVEDILVLAQHRGGGLTDLQWEHIVDGLKAALGRYERGSWPAAAHVQRTPRGLDVAPGFQLLPRQPLPVHDGSREIDLRAVEKGDLAPPWT